MMDKDKLLQGITTVLFDLDGTLVDSMWMWEEIDREYLDRFGLSCREDQIEKIEGMGFADIAVYYQQEFGIAESAEVMKQTWMDMAYEKYAHKVPLKKGVLPFLKELQERGIRMGIASSNSHTLIEACLSHYGILKWFSAVKSVDDVSRSKPAPDVYLSAASELGADPDSCLVFEDVPKGAMAGKNAGMRVCGVYDRYCCNQQALRELADVYIESYEELL